MKLTPVSLLELTDAKLHHRLVQFEVADDRTGALVAAIGHEFAAGYNDALHHFDPQAVRSYVEAQADDYLTPFYVEGASMAFAAARALHPAKARTAHRDLLAELPTHKYLIFAGWGWWYAVRPGGAFGLNRSPVWKLNNLFTSLAIDGMAFAACFLRSDPPRFDVSCPFQQSDQRRLWTQGYGRALWFVAGGRPETLRSQHDRLDADLRPELHAGVGLATAFASLRELSSLPIAASTDEADQRAFNQGLAFGLTARREASPRTYQGFLDRLDDPSARWVADVTDRCLAPPHDTAASYTAWQRTLRDELPMGPPPR